jgi:hypothetical protein
LLMLSALSKHPLRNGNRDDAALADTLARQQHYRCASTLATISSAWSPAKFCKAIVILGIAGFSVTSSQVDERFRGCYDT